MRFTLLALVSCAVSVYASGHDSAADLLKKHPYIKPKATDLRGPCPGLNTYVAIEWQRRSAIN
jgi:hypothetical protein